MVTTDLQGSADSTDIANALAILPSGKILVAGTAHNTSTSMDFALARYRSDGRLDRTFGSDGRVTTDFFGNFDVGATVALDSHDRILLAGAAFSDEGRDDFALARYRADGRLDERFGDGGKDRWELSPPLEVALESGRQVIEFLSIGGGSVHVDEISLEGECEED